jgi:hypothetical protein
MPVYSEKLTIPANTSINNPVSLDIVLKQKLINRMEVSFPSGCRNLVGVQIKYGIKQFWPEKEDTWLWGENKTVAWEERFEMPSVNEKLTIYGCSPGTIYDHTIVVRIMTLPQGFYFLETLLQALQRLWEKII